MKELKLKMIDCLKIKRRLILEITGINEIFDRNEQKLQKWK